MNRQEIASLIFSKIQENKGKIITQFKEACPEIPFFYVDDLLPEDLVRKLYEVFPKSDEMVLKKSVRENKFVSAQMNLFNPLLEEVIYAFQDPKIVQLIGEICNIESLFPDSNLYAGGLSRMEKEQFLNPHLDNSHDKDRNRWRVLNLLFYVSPDWEITHGGNLELWPNGLKNEPITILSKQNRLAVMATHNNSLHSVSPTKVDKSRCCISNYYFSDNPLREEDSFHVTSFRGRPEQKTTDFILRFDTQLRMLIRKFFKKGIVENPHVYRKENKS